MLPHGIVTHPNQVVFTGGRGGAASRLIAEVGRDLSGEFLVGYDTVAEGPASPAGGTASLDCDLVLWERDGAEVIPSARSVGERHRRSSVSGTDLVEVRCRSGGAEPAEELIAVVASAAGPCREAVPRLRPHETSALAEAIRSHLLARALSRPLYGLVLAGGMSSRMGRDKWLLEYHDGPHAAYLHGLLATILERAFISVRPSQAREQGLASMPLLVDAYEGLGPLGGMLTAMTTYPEAAWLVLACDLPFVEAATIARLISQRTPLRFATAYRSSSDGGPEPLCAIYEPKALLPLRDLADRGHAGPRTMLLDNRVGLLDAADELELLNVNHPEEHGKALDLLRAGRTG